MSFLDELPMNSRHHPGKLPANSQQASNTFGKLLANSQQASDTFSKLMENSQQASDTFGELLVNSRQAFDSFEKPGRVSTSGSATQPRWFTRRKCPDSWIRAIQLPSLGGSAVRNPGYGRLNRRPPTVQPSKISKKWFPSLFNPDLTHMLINPLVN
ncbi:hypothetical protein B296_00013958 [Ensete ventricosum]|uniref:Uncharacterized protein n=1 Tax=Ensete ventricosum TaxID=4639 RepID=A0A426ZF41_ENSVE|nr:hypothetical protein B296_00013958 [Ensete ventricosum]